MTKNLIYQINGKNLQVSILDSPAFLSGNDEVLSNATNDVVYGQNWYQEGHTSAPFLETEEFKALQSGLTKVVKEIIERELEGPTDGFTLEKYHHYVQSNEDHYKIVRKTRDLFPEDFHFPIIEMIPKFEKLLGFKLLDYDTVADEKVHIIVRINRPQSNDFNPPHKDMYEAFDQHDYIPHFVNFWIPIAGVTDKSSLPIAPGSHLINEKNITRTFEGGVVEGNKYRVRMIKDWNGDNKLIRADVKDGEVLIFSSHLIHGLAKNEEEDLTRVALEFRLFKA